MPKYTIISKLMSEDVDFIKDSLYDTRYNLLKRGNFYYAHVFGHTRNRDILEEIEAELVSLGVYTIEHELFWGV